MYPWCKITGLLLPGNSRLLQLLLNAHVFAPQDLGHRHLLIGGGRILWIGEQRPDLSRLDVAVADLEGRRLIPGFIDGHAHVTGGGGESGFSSRVPPLPLSRFTAAGVTTVVGVLGTDDSTRDTRALLAQTRSLRADGLSAWCHTGGYHVPPVTLTGNVRDDIVHLDPVIGVGEVALSDHRSSQPTLDEILRIASEAHVAGMITGKAGILHLHLGDGKRGLDLVRQALHTSELPPRVFNPTHINRRKDLFAEALDLARRGCTVDMTAFPVAEDDDAWAADVGLQKYLDSGAPIDKITISSDGGGCLPRFNDQGELVHMDVGRPGTLGETLQALLSRGVPLDSVLPAFTTNVAQILRLHDKGRIRAGADADLIVLGGEGEIRDVMAAGIWHVQDGRQQVFGQFEKQSNNGPSG
ncbi:MAG: beta-aspartyl-peptidase [Gammaproteobacteria bacterium]|nr:beta-aspartyl-peptidase [Gammaproteobacteria bacterium]